jgi:hypothetical protein
MAGDNERQSKRRRTASAKNPSEAAAETIAKKRPIEADFKPPETSDFRARAVEQLAKHLAAAYLAYAMDLNFPEAMRYVLRQPCAGDLWTAAARFIFGAISLIERVHGR